MPAVGEAEKADRAAKLDEECIFSDLLLILLKFQYGKCTNMEFSQKFQMQRYVFFHSHSIPCCLVDPGIFSLAF